MHQTKNKVHGSKTEITLALKKNNSRNLIAIITIQS